MSRVQEEAAKRGWIENAYLAVEMVVRPPRCEYSLTEITPVKWQRGEPPIPPVPVELRNRHGFKIVGSLYRSMKFETEDVHHCVIYLHGNVGSQREGRTIVPWLVPNGVSVFCFDFTGSGNSEGQYITLGITETEDVLDVIEFLTTQMELTDFILWGRSMGAATAIMVGHKHERIKGIIVDSAYMTVHDLLISLAQQVGIPSFLCGVAIWWIKREVRKMSGLECDNIRPIDDAAVSTVPLLLGHSREDEVIPFEQATQIFEAYKGGTKTFIPMHGGHNDKRCEEWRRECMRFIAARFEVEIDAFDGKGQVRQEPAPEHAARVQDLLKK